MATLVFMLERKILISSFFSQLIELFHGTMKKEIENPPKLTYSYPNP